MFSDKRMTMALLALNGALLALLVIVEMSGSGVWAQATSGAVGSTMAMITGEPSPNQDEPIFIVDSRNETICIYEFNVGTRKFGLKAARTYKYDKEIEEFMNEKPGVKDVKGGRLGRAGGGK
jgi:hypothetical protein